MNLTMQTRNMRLTKQVREWIERRLAFALGRFASSLTEVRACVSDENGPRGGVDKQCTLEARLRSSGSVLVEVRDADTESAVSRAADRLARRVRDTLAKRRDVRRRQRADRE